MLGFIIMWSLTAAAVLVAAVICYALYERVLRRGVGSDCAAVLVVGDYGRSPRMQYHTVSLAGACRRVYVVADSGSPPCKEVTAHPNIDLSLLMGPILPPAGLPWVLQAVLKVALQLLRLPYMLLFRLPKCGVVVLQNPPALPILPVAVLACRLRGMRLLLDWHNLGYTLMEMDGRPKPFVQLYKSVERGFGRYSSGNLCVCDSLRRFLTDDWGCIRPDNSVVMYDCAPAFFKRGGPAEFDTLVHGGLAKLLRDTGLSGAFVEGGKWKADRPALLVSGTSWTIDEDVSMLIDALSQVDALIQSGERQDLPKRVLAVITGKGGVLKTQCEEKIRKLGLRHVCVVTGFLDSLADYASLVGCADFGVSLHNSSSGLDLPMKVVDMLGCSLPVAALHFPTLDELVTPSNGVTFEGRPDSVYSALLQFLSGWEVDPSNQRAASPLLQEKRAYLLAEPRPRWDDEWQAKALPLLKRLQASL